MYSVVHNSYTDMGKPHYSLTDFLTKIQKSIIFQIYFPYINLMCCKMIDRSMLIIYILHMPSA